MIARLLKAIRGNDSDPELDALRAVVTQNDADRAFVREKINGLALKLQTDHDRARAALTSDPTEKNLEAFLTAFPNNALPKILLEVAAQCQQSVSARCLNRTREPLRRALEKIHSRLTSEREEVEKL